MESPGRIERGPENWLKRAMRVQGVTVVRTWEEAGREEKEREERR